MSPIDKSTASKADNDPESIRALVASLGFEPVGDTGKADSESTDSSGNGSEPSDSAADKPSDNTERILGNGNAPTSEKVSDDEIAPMAKKPRSDNSNGNGNGRADGSKSTSASRRKRRKRKSAQNGGQAQAKSPSATAASVAELGLNEELTSKSEATPDSGDTRSDDSGPDAVKAKSDGSAPADGSVDATTTDSVESKSAGSATESDEAKVKDSSKQTTDADTDDTDTATMDIAGDAATTADDGSKRVHESSKGDNGTVSAADQAAGTDPDNSVSGEGIAVEKGIVDDFDYTGDDTVVVDNKSASGTIADGVVGGVKIVSEKSFPASKAGSDSSDKETGSDRGENQTGSDSGDNQTGSKNGDKTGSSTEAKNADTIEIVEAAKVSGDSSEDPVHDGPRGSAASGDNGNRDGARDQDTQAKGDSANGADKASSSTSDAGPVNEDKSTSDPKEGVEAKTEGDKPGQNANPDEKAAATDSSKDDDEASGDKSKKTETTREVSQTTTVDGSATKGGAAPLDDILDDVKVDSPVRASSSASEDLINLDSPEFSSIAGTPSAAPQPTGDVPKVRVDNPAPAVAPTKPIVETTVEAKPEPTRAPAFDPESMPTGVVVPVVSKAGVKPTGWVEYFGTPFDPTTQLQARKVRRVIRHIDPWSVLTFSVLFHMCVFAALLLASVLVWNVADAAGTIENLENFILELGDFKTFTIDGQQVFRAGVAIAGILTLASSVLMVLMTVVFNLLSDLIGGIRVTVVEEETVRLRKLEN